MSFSKVLFSFLFLSVTLNLYLANAATFDIRNNCPNTVWAAAVHGGGMGLDWFNIPMEFSSVSRGCNRVIRCTVDIIEECPNELKSYPQDDPTSIFSCPRRTNYKIVLCL
ncbi:hypothetical protein ACOSP7_021394 [Xanthoceras sorbifolium]